METRTILQILLGLIVTAVVLLGLVIVYQLNRSPTVVVDKTVQQKTGAATSQEKTHKWEARDDEAIELAKSREVDGEEGTIADRLADDDFVEETLGYGDLEKVGWRATWWGETKYGAHFYLVEYVFRDGVVEVGPHWLVSLKDEQVVPKNVTARVATNPEEGKESEYYDQRREVVSAITKHTFGSGVNLAGTLLLYFVDQTGMGRRGDEGGGASGGDGDAGGETRADAGPDAGDAGGAEEGGESGSGTVRGWTIQHSRDNLFRAYFQWREGGDTKYAEFEFDYDRKALKPVNLHAGNIMRYGEDLEQKERVDILPRTFNPEANRPADQWSGKAANAWEKPKFRGHLKAQGQILNKRDLVTAVEWLLTTRVEDPDEFAECRQDERCKWKTEQQGESVYRVKYLYDLGDGEKQIAWDVDLEAEDESISPVDRLSQLAYRAVVPRN